MHFSLKYKYLLVIKSLWNLLSPNWSLWTKGAVTWGDLSLWHIPTTKSHTWHTVQHAATCRCNELQIKIASWGRPTIGLFSELSQRHVAGACHMRGPNVCNILSLRHVTATSCGIELHKNMYMYVTGCNLPRGHIAATTCLLWQDLKEALSNALRTCV